MLARLAAAPHCAVIGEREEEKIFLVCVSAYSPYRPEGVSLLINPSTPLSGLKYLAIAVFWP
jgi:hypothetical protein